MASDAVTIASIVTSGAVTLLATGVNLWYQSREAQRSRQWQKQEGDANRAFQKDLQAESDQRSRDAKRRLRNAERVASTYVSLIERSGELSAELRNLTPDKPPTRLGDAVHAALARSEALSWRLGAEVAAYGSEDVAALFDKWDSCRMQLAEQADVIAQIDEAGLDPQGILEKFGVHRSQQWTSVIQRREDLSEAFGELRRRVNHELRELE